MMKTVVITGCTSGIGYTLARHLLINNYVVYGLGRNKTKLDDVLEGLDLSLHRNYHPIKADFTNLSEVKKATDLILKTLHTGLDVLINNAAIVPKPKKITDDGFEMQYQVNHLVPVYMTEKLLPMIYKKQGIVITTSSDAHKRAKFIESDIHALRKYHTFRSYCRTKLYNVMMTNYYIRNYQEVQFYAVHPGRVKTDIGTKDTSKLYAMFWRWFTRKGLLPKESIPTYMMLIEKQPLSGYYYLEKPHSTLAVSEDSNKQDFLIELALKELASFL